LLAVAPAAEDAGAAPIEEPEDGARRRRRGRHRPVLAARRPC
jgi:hypothetical protein